MTKLLEPHDQTYTAKYIWDLRPVPSDTFYIVYSSYISTVEWNLWGANGWHRTLAAFNK